MRDYRGRSGITLRSRRRTSRARVVVIVLLAVAIVAALVTFWPHSDPATDTTAAIEPAAQPGAKGAIPLEIPGQSPKPGASDSE
jgi:hypothetical protein